MELGILSLYLQSLALAQVHPPNITDCSPSAAMQFVSHQWKGTIIELPLSRHAQSSFDSDMFSVPIKVDTVYIQGVMQWHYLYLFIATNVSVYLYSALYLL